MADAQVPGARVSSGLHALRARYVFPVDREPIRDGWILIRGERIEAVGGAPSPPPTAATIDLGCVAIVPGLVNAHTHLEFSQLDQPLPNRDGSFPDWIRGVVGWRRAGAHEVPKAIQQGLAECLASGTTTLGEIANPPCNPSAYRNSLVGCTVFHELIGLAQEQIHLKLAAARDFLEQFHAEPNLTSGLSPHAPYTVHPLLMEQVCELAAQSGAPLAFHLAESEPELELLATARGPFRDLLQDLGAWRADAFASARRPIDYLRIMAAVPRVLVIHGNYLTSEETDFLASHRDRLSLVYCARTHHGFRHRGYPLAERLRAGVALALGTDGRGSNPDLNMLSEARFVAGAHPEVSPAQVLRLATLAGARALGCDHLTGSLGAGKLANLAIIPVQDGTPQDPHDLLFASDQGVSQILVRGRLVHGVAI